MEEEVPMMDMLPMLLYCQLRLVKNRDCLIPELLFCWKETKKVAQLISLFILINTKRESEFPTLSFAWILELWTMSICGLPLPSEELLLQLSQYRSLMKEFILVMLQELFLQVSESSDNYWTELMMLLPEKCLKISKLMSLLIDMPN